MNPDPRHPWLRKAGIGPSGPWPGCDGRQLARWADRGGPLPRALAAHVRGCPACWREVQRINRVHASLNLLSTQALPAQLPAQANTHALRMLKRAARASEAAARLIRMRPELTFGQKVQIHLARLSLSAVATVVLLGMRIGWVAGVEKSRDTQQMLSSAYWNKCVDPYGNWKGPEA